MKKIIYSDEAPKPSGIYSQGTVGGGLIFVSGQLPVDPKTIKFIEQDIKKQTRQVFKNIEKILAAEGAGLKDILKISAFLLNIDDFKGMNEVFQEFFPAEPPARTTITVKAFPPGILVEIDAIALKPS
ncbi:MAG: reactive intermediate/imine deaminase [Actinobacteria bacterium RBG_13_35_12]|nr:MAG: reactive intermediate/imine deaminase [Actinobacteria bacterium RBG_13_35_12]